MYYANVIPGLEAITSAELARKLPEAAVSRMEAGRVCFSHPASPADLLTLRTTEDVFAHVAVLEGLPGDETGLAAIEARMREVDLSAALAAHRSVRDQPAHPSFRITATREGEQEYRSQLIAAYAGAAIVTRRGWRVDLEHPDIDIWVEVRGDRAVVGVRLSSDEMSRRSRVAHGVASLKPTVAHAMCLLSGPAPNEVFLDPMCGAGTILVERESALPGASIVGADRDLRPLESASANLRAAAADARLLQADARGLPLADASVDKIVCNLPWGRRIGSHRANRRLYPAFLAEALRVLKPNGTMVLLTVERRLMEGLLAEASCLIVGSRTKINLGGLEPSIYLCCVR